MRVLSMGFGNTKPVPRIVVRAWRCHAPKLKCTPYFLKFVTNGRFL